MARDKSETMPQDFSVTDAQTPGLPAMVEAQRQFDVLEANYNADRDLVNQLLGQAQMSEAFAKFSVTVTTSKIAYIKENKLYRALRGMKSGDGHHFSGTWEDFCQLLGRSREQIDEDIRNLNVMGEEALDSMNRMGIGYREMRQYRKLPTDAKEALIEAAKTGDKETLLDLAEELISRHVKEKTDLTAQVEELEANYEAQGRVLAQKNSAFDKLSEQFHAKESRTKTLPPDEVAKELRSEANLFAFQAQHALYGQLDKAFHALTEHAADNGGDHLEYMSGLVNQVELELLKLREKYNLKTLDDGGAIPDWLQEAKADWDAKHPEGSED